MKEKVQPGKSSSSRSRQSKSCVPPATNDMDSSKEEPKRAAKRKTEVELLELDEHILELGKRKRVTRSNKASKSKGAGAAAPASPSPASGTQGQGKSPEPRPGCSRTSKNAEQNDPLPDVSATGESEHKVKSGKSEELGGKLAAPECVTDCPSSPTQKGQQVRLEPVCTPKQAKSLNDSMECVPSPMTPWMPETPIALSQGRRMEEADVAPSPQGMSLPQTASLNHVTENVLVKQETLTLKEKPSISMDVDNSLATVRTSRLDLDGLIDEIFSQNSSNPSPGDDSVSLDIGSFDLTLDSPVSGIDGESPEQEGEHSISSQTDTGGPDLYSTPTDLMSVPEDQPAASCPVATEEKAAINSETACCADLNSRSKQASPAGAQMEHPNVTLSLEKENISQTPAESIPDVKKTDSQGESTLNVNSAEESNSVPKPMKSAVDSEEHFSEELTLTHSQYLFIDEKCTALKEELQDLPLQPMTAHPQPQRETDIAHKFSAPSTSRSLQNFGFTVPPAPRMEWVTKTVESRQRLRTLIQEISRLNAMVLRARRTLWPRQKPDQTAQPKHHATANPTTHQRVSERQTAQFSLPDLSKEPEWNIS